MCTITSINILNFPIQTFYEVHKFFVSIAQALSRSTRLKTRTFLSSSFIYFLPQKFALSLSHSSIILLKSNLLSIPSSHHTLIEPLLQKPKPQINLETSN